MQIKLISTSKERIKEAAQSSSWEICSRDVWNTVMSFMRKWSVLLIKPRMLSSVSYEKKITWTLETHVATCPWCMESSPYLTIVPFCTRRIVLYILTVFNRITWYRKSLILQTGQSLDNVIWKIIYIDWQKNAISTVFVWSIYTAMYRDIGWGTCVYKVEEVFLWRGISVIFFSLCVIFKHWCSSKWNRFLIRV